MYVQSGDSALLYDTASQKKYRTQWTGLMSVYGDWLTNMLYTHSEVVIRNVNSYSGGSVGVLHYIRSWQVEESSEEKAGGSQVAIQ